jgi:hypothetical protein
VGWTIFIAIDLYVSVVLLDLMSTSLPPEKLPRLRTAKKVALACLAISLIVLALQFARRHGWLGA